MARQYESGHVSSTVRPRCHRTHGRRPQEALRLDPAATRRPCRGVAVLGVTRRELASRGPHLRGCRAASWRDGRTAGDHGRGPHTGRSSASEGRRPPQVRGACGRTAPTTRMADRNGGRHRHGPSSGMDRHPRVPSADRRRPGDRDQDRDPRCRCHPAHPWVVRVGSVGRRAPAGLAPDTDLGGDAPLGDGSQRSPSASQPRGLRRGFSGSRSDPCQAGRRCGHDRGAPLGPCDDRSEITTKPVASAAPRRRSTVGRAVR